MRGDISSSESESSNSSSAKREEKVRQAIGITSERCQFGLSRSAIEILQLFLGSNAVLEKLLSIPLFHDIICDTHLIRSVLIHLPIFSNLLALNPDLISIIYNDEEFGSIIKQIFDIQYDFATRLEMVGDNIESKIGHRLVFTNEQVGICIAYYCDE